MKNLIQKCDWEITTRCNLNCKHCIINHHPKKELSTKGCLLIIDLLKKLGCKQINFTGGEALIKKDFPKILEYSHDKGMTNHLFTNGTNLSQKNLPMIKRYISSIGVSLEGLEKANDIVRGKGSYKKIMHCLKLLKKNKIPFGIYITLNKYNFVDLDKLLKLVKQFNPFNISINELVLRGRAKKNKNRLYEKINRKQILILFKKIFPNEKLKLEKGCRISPKNLFLTSEGKFYFCTEIRQCKKENYLGRFIPQKLNKFYRFIKQHSKANLSKQCPYVSYTSKNITLNLLTGEKCPYLR